MTADVANSSIPQVAAYGVVFVGPPAAALYPPLAIPVATLYRPALSIIALSELMPPEVPAWR